MMYYTQNGHAIGISNSGDIVILDPEELDYIHNDLPRNRYSPTLADLATTFPEAAKSIKEEVKIRRKKILDLREVGWKWKSWANKQNVMSPQAKDILSTLLVETHSDYPISVLEGEIDSLNRVLTLIDMKKKGKTLDNGNLNIAKNVPITNFMEFNRSGFTNCLWHSEKTGSLKYNKKLNRVYCFGACGKGYDVVDVVQKMFNYSFSEAINFLSK